MTQYADQTTGFYNKPKNNETTGGFMKKIILLLAVAFISIKTMGAEVCTNQEGSIIYDSATKLGNSLIVVNPRVMAGGVQANVIGTTYNRDSGQGLCKLLGYSKARVSSQGDPSKYFASFSSDGELINFGYNQDGYYIIHTVVCRN